MVKKVEAQQDECRQITEDCQLAEPLGVEKNCCLRHQPFQVAALADTEVPPGGVKTR